MSESQSLPHRVVISLAALVPSLAIAGEMDGSYSVTYGLAVDALANFGTQWVFYTLIFYAVFALVCYSFLTIVRRYRQSRSQP